MLHVRFLCEKSYPHVSIYKTQHGGAISAKKIANTRFRKKCNISMESNLGKIPMTKISTAVLSVGV